MATATTRLAIVTANSTRSPLADGRETSEISKALRALTPSQRARIDAPGPALVETFEQLLELLKDRNPHILHFSGHGQKRIIMFGGLQQDALFAQPQPLDIEEFARELQKHVAAGGALRLVVLNCCESDSLAALLATGTPPIAAVGTNDRVLEDQATHFSPRFYGALLGSARPACECIDAATSSGIAFEHPVVYTLHGDPGPLPHALPQQIPGAAQGLSRDEAFCFVGRHTELALLDQQLGASGSMTVICGMGGVGKTTLARAACTRAQERGQRVLWLRCSDRAMLEQETRRIATEELGLAWTAEEREYSKIAAAVRKELCSRVHGWILVVDNADDPAHVAASWIQRGHGALRGAVLATSRAVDWGRGAKKLRLDVLPPDEAAQALCKHAECDENVNLDQHDAAALEWLAGAEGLAGLPLALAHAGSWVCTTRSGFAAYKSRLLERRDNALAHTPQMTQSLLQQLGLDRPEQQAVLKRLEEMGTTLRIIQHSPDKLAELTSGMAPETAVRVRTAVADWQPAVGETWAISIKAAIDMNAAAGEALQVLAFCAPDGVPARIVELVAEQENSPLSALRDGDCASAVLALEQLSLVRCEGTSLVTHRLVQAVQQDAMVVETEVYDGVLRTVQAALAKQLPSYADYDEGWETAKARAEPWLDSSMHACLCTRTTSNDFMFLSQSILE
eukprot:m.257008 g.257008  ORF g.257008 m.257008 type:complete len:682 (-) comp11026_c0_seq1:157-2202(-)